MVELKTLKDFNWSKSLEGHKKQLKAEAIKWVEDYEGRWGEEQTIMWIKHFFNITEEELK